MRTTVDGTAGAGVDEGGAEGEGGVDGEGAPDGDGGVEGDGELDGDGCADGALVGAPDGDAPGLAAGAALHANKVRARVNRASVDFMRA
jgi:hypothetical protein